MLKKQMLDEHRLKYVIQIQRAWRRIRNRKQGIVKTRGRVLMVQANFRRVKAAVEVETIRVQEGPNVGRLPSQLVALMPDQEGMLSRYRAFRPKEPAVRKMAKLVRLKVLPKHLLLDLQDAVAPIQSFVKWRLKCRAIVRIQAALRGSLARLRLRRRLAAAIRIQRWWCNSNRSFKKLQEQVQHLQRATRGMLTRRRLARQRAEAAAIAANEEKQRLEEERKAFAMKLMNSTLMAMTMNKERKRCTVVDQDSYRVKVRYEGGSNDPAEEWLTLDSPRILSWNVQDDSLEAPTPGSGRSASVAGGSRWRSDALRQGLTRRNMASVSVPSRR